MTIINSFKEVAQDFKAAVLSPTQIKDPKRLSRVCQLSKVGIVAVGVAVLAASLFTGPIALIFAGLFSLALYDAYKIADNIQKISDKSGVGRFAQELVNQVSEETVGKRIAEGTIFARLILDLTLPKPVGAES